MEAFCKGTKRYLLKEDISGPRARIPTRDVSVIFVLVKYKANIDLLDM
jgi:hypothetical protein